MVKTKKLVSIVVSDVQENLKVKLADNTGETATSYREFLELKQYIGGDEVVNAEKLIM